MSPQGLEQQAVMFGKAKYGLKFHQAIEDAAKNGLRAIRFGLHKSTSKGSLHILGPE